MFCLKIYLLQLDSYVTRVLKDFIFLKLLQVYNNMG